mmetsp:Transcript_3484/g.3947  ORF Transcript_3484/g.3947 Transcript_3484/m.3947 type:complete len:88 (-) Transcript_3484:24-287(-)
MYHLGCFVTPDELYNKLKPPHSREKTLASLINNPLVTLEPAAMELYGNELADHIMDPRSRDPRNCQIFATPSPTNRSATAKSSDRRT